MARKWINVISALVPHILASFLAFLLRIQVFMIYTVWQYVHLRFEMMYFFYVNNYVLDKTFCDDTFHSMTGPLVQDNESDVLAKRNLCSPCPRGASCELGGRSVVPLPGYWTATETVIRRADLNVLDSRLNDLQLYQCLPGTAHPTSTH
jgi:hypothetical protein